MCLQCKRAFVTSAAEIDRLPERLFRNLLDHKIGKIQHASPLSAHRPSVYRRTMELAGNLVD